MAYVGRPLSGGKQWQKLDTPTTSSNAFTMQVGGVAVTPAPEHVIIAVNGVIQEPDSGFTISGSTLTFTGTVVAQGTDKVWGMIAGDAAFAAASTINEDRLQISNAGSNGQFLSKQSGNTGGLTWATVSTFDPDGAATFNDTGAAVDFRIESDDNANMFFVDGSEDRVGIGTATPATTLDVAKTSAGGDVGITIHNTDNTTDSTDETCTLYGKMLTTATVAGKIVFARSGNYSGGGDNASKMHFYTADDGSDQLRMTIDKSGNVGIGTQAAPSSSQSGFWVSEGFKVKIGRGSGTGAETMMAFVNGNGTVGTVTTNGSATAYNTSSDYRLKENEVAVSDGLSRINQLKPYDFNFKNDPDLTISGFFAHEVSDIVPEAITGDKDEVDDDGEMLKQQIDQSKLIPIIVAALQELSEKVEALES